jgi:DNA polymerase
LILQALDFANIESRVLAWLFDEQWKLDAFRAQDDGTGADVYKLLVARLFRKPVESVTKFERQAVGKVLELALGFEGGVGAIVTMAETYGVDLVELARMAEPGVPDDVMSDSRRSYVEFFKPNGQTHGLSERTFVVLNALKLMWRASNSKITAGFRSMKEGAELAIRYPGKVYKIPNGKIKFKVVDTSPERDDDPDMEEATGVKRSNRSTQWLYMLLPSGRKLAYFEPEVEGDGNRTSIYFRGVDTDTRQWTRTSTYGGKLVENAVQATARDLLVFGMFGLERAGYPIIGHVHDEAVMEIDESFGSLEHAGEVMCALPPWATGLPVKYSGWRAKRFKKD